MQFRKPLRYSLLTLLGFISFSIALSAQTPTPTPLTSPTPAPVQTPPPAPPTDSDDVIKVDSRLVVVPVSVTDQAGEPVLGLTIKDFRIAEEGKAQVIENVGNAENVPLEIALLFDVSASTDAMFTFQQETAAKFLREVLRGDDRATIFTVGVAPILVQARDTADRSQIAIKSISPTKEQTAFYDSVRVAAEYLAKNSPPGRRKVLVVISDGEDTNSDGVLKAIWAAERKIADNVQGAELRQLRVRARDNAKVVEQAKVLRALQNADAVFFSINPGGSSLQLNQISQFGQDNMQKFAVETGGTAFLPKFAPIDSKDDLQNSFNARKNTATLELIFKQLANELRAQYLVQYYSEADYPTNRYVKLEVGLQNPAGRRVRARQGYYVKN